VEAFKPWVLLLDLVCNINQIGLIEKKLAIRTPDVLPRLRSRLVWPLRSYVEVEHLIGAAVARVRLLLHALACRAEALQLRLVCSFHPIRSLVVVSQSRRHARVKF
jgi:hypothetical protein